LTKFVVHGSHGDQIVLLLSLKSLPHSSFPALTSLTFLMGSSQCSCDTANNDHPSHTISSPSGVFSRTVPSHPHQPMLHQRSNYNPRHLGPGFAAMATSQNYHAGREEQLIRRRARRHRGRSGCETPARRVSSHSPTGP
jgi:hypothetical protein